MNTLKVRRAAKRVGLRVTTSRGRYTLHNEQHRAAFVMALCPASAVLAECRRRRLHAIHEAGHVVALLSFGGGFRSVRLDDFKQRLCHSFVGAARVPEGWMDLFVALAGPAAEFIHRGRYDAPGWDDPDNDWAQFAQMTKKPKDHRGAERFCKQVVVPHLREWWGAVEAIAEALMARGALSCTECRRVFNAVSA